VAHPLSRSVNSPHRRATGSEPLTDDKEQLWYGAISVGTPPVDFTGTMFLAHGGQSHCLTIEYTVAFDTGSSDLFLPSVNCSSGCEGHTTYDPSASSTSQDLGKPFELSLGDGSSASGDLYSDVVQIAGLTVCRNTPTLLLVPSP